MTARLPKRKKGIRSFHSQLKRSECAVFFGDLHHGLDVFRFGVATQGAAAA